MSGAPMQLDAFARHAAEIEAAAACAEHNVTACNGCREEVAREAVMQRYETWHEKRLRICREAMVEVLGRKQNEYGAQASVSANDLRRWLEQHPQWDAEGGHNWRAAVFASKEWEWTGEMVESTAKGGHRCRVQCYRLKGTP